MSFIAELKRRNVFRVAVAYIVLAWIILQVGDTLAPALHLPETVNSILAFFLILGFPLALFFAWAFELTPDGLKLEKNVDRDSSITPNTGRKLDRTIIALLVVALGYFVWQSQKTTVEPEDLVARDQSIAVLPFENMSSDKEQEYFSDGLSEELLNLLAKIPELKVSSRSSAFSYKGKDFKIPEVGRELNVAYVLEGSVRKSGDKVRITAQLIEAETDVHLWSETWDRTLDDIFVIQDEIAKAVVDELKVRLLGEMPQVMATDGEAYSLILQARYALVQRTFDSLSRAESLIKRAIEIDPDYAPAWTDLAFIYSAQGDIGLTLPNEVLPLARDAVEKSLELDPDYGRAHAQLADILISFGRDYRGGKREIDIALSIDSSDVETIYHAAILEVMIGNAASALTMALDLNERDPLFAPGVVTLLYVYEVLGQFDKAVDTARKLREISPNAFGTSYYLANTLLFAGEFSEALQVIENEKLDGFRYTSQAAAHFAAGNLAESDKALAALLSIERGGWDYQHVQVYAFRGELDKAFAALEKAYEMRDSGVQLILGDPYLENMRIDPRYEEFVQRIGIRLHEN
jgi:TolB-like protein